MNKNKMSTLSISAKFFALILLLQIIVAVTGKSRSALRKSTIKKAKAFDPTPFHEISKSWVEYTQVVHNMSDQLFDSFNSNGAPVPMDAFRKALDAYAPLTVPSAENSNELNLWLFKVDTNSNEVDREGAFAFLFNSIAGVAMDTIKGHDDNIPEGPHKAEIQKYVDRSYILFTNLKKLTKSVFEQADVNHTGFLSIQEFKESFGTLLRKGEDVEQIFRDLDTNRSGELDLDEASHVLGKIMASNNN